MRYCSRCRMRTVQRCDTKGDPAKIPGPTAPGSACSALAGGSCVHLARMFSLIGVFFLIGILCLRHQKEIRQIHPWPWKAAATQILMA